MLGQGFSPDAVDYGNRTGLMLAAANGQKVGTATATDTGTATDTKTAGLVAITL
ncbi:hypothetical protein MNEG_16346 [Monoraphidium neglectum]|uniref:Uncharacterized protein n=1 Tax=Monoraphidium neglectum TaxID=145388 RepID=A0A0D2K652_9CHLO|nr:hypothetical protein MNEG_16346 [Monoraphidium neglectum]KIY91618.1 hypothetical protein MNEG_16346 [Monoraphidium neglectum]|eukprot:XP_013890638.1 hypothetical protein MNEG_16346 [Monoraphidium neglectum]